MPRDVRLTSALNGQSFTLGAGFLGDSVSRGIVDYLHQNTAGTISIVTDRTTLQLAPDRVRFTVDLSASTFSATSTYDDVADKTYANGYNPSLHNLIYLWDTGDATTWDAPDKTLTAWQNKRYQNGPVIQHVYGAGGTYSVQLTVIEPSTGKVASTTASITVDGDIDAAYPTTQTICINPVGDSDFTGAPTGATQVNLDTITEATSEWSSRLDFVTQYRWLFKRGTSCSVDLRIRGGAASGVFFGAYGTGADPIINAVEGQDIFDINYFNTGYRELRFTGLDLRGTFDPTSELVTGRPYTRPFFGTQGSHLDMCVYKVNMQGFSGTLCNMDMSSAHQHRIAFDDCTATDFGGEYNFILGDCEEDESTFSLTGSKIAANPSAVSDDSLIRSTVRVKAMKYTYISGNDIFNTSYNNMAFRLADGYATTPPAGSVMPMLTVVNSNAVEANGGFAGVGFNDSARGAYVNNTIIEGNIGCNMWNSQHFFRVIYTGVTIRNNIFWQPGTPADANDLLAFLNFFQDSDGVLGTIPDAPISFYSNTCVSDRTDAQNGGTEPLIMQDRYGNHVDAGIVTVENNITHQPNATPAQTTFAPLSSTTLFTPRSTVGRVLGADLPSPTPDASYATSGNMAYYRPTTGSSAINGATTGLVFYDDFEGTERPATPTTGALEP